MEFESALQAQLEKYKEFDNGIEGFRYFKLQQLQEDYSNHGFPESCTKLELSLMPTVFQEANYDDINWAKQNARLRHMNPILELDCMFHNEGKMRSRLERSQFDRYVQFSLEAIRKATRG